MGLRGISLRMSNKFHERSLSGRGAGGGVGLAAAFAFLSFARRGKLARKAEKLRQGAIDFKLTTELDDKEEEEEEEEVKEDETTEDEVDSVETSDRFTDALLSKLQGMLFTARATTEMEVEERYMI